MLIPHRFHSEAELEFGEAVAFYESRGPGLGAAFLVEVERVVALVRERPEIGPRLGSRLRRVLVRRFPYSVIYQQSSGSLLVLAIAHQGRRPGYWRNRM